MKAETLKEVLESYAREHSSGHDAPARAASVQLQQLCYAATNYLALLGILDAHVIRSCPECGGTHVTPKPYGDERDRGRTFSACPACADAPTAIVSAALREKAMDLLHPYLRDGDPHTRGEAGELFDAVLSTVLGHVRYAKEMLTAFEMRSVPDDDGTQWLKYDTNEVWEQQRHEVGRTTPVAILEEAGKEGDK